MDFTNRNSIIKWILFTLGIVCLSFGISLTVQAKVLGVSPWDSFHLGLLHYLPFNFGQICQGVGAVAILIGMLLGIKPKLGTILNMLFIGWLVNFFLDVSLISNINTVNLFAFLVFILGVIFCGIGTGLYIAADVGIGPRDSIMVGLNKKFGIKIGIARTFLEVTVVILGFLLSGPIGIGTVIFSLTIGYFVEKTLLTVNNLILKPKSTKNNNW